MATGFNNKTASRPYGTGISLGYPILGNKLPGYYHNVPTVRTTTAMINDNDKTATAQ